MKVSLEFFKIMHDAELHEYDQWVIYKIYIWVY